MTEHSAAPAERGTPGSHGEVPLRERRPEGSNPATRALSAIGLFLQQAIALFVLKSDAGFKIFKWIATLASDFLDQGLVGAEFFFDADTIGKHWFYVNTLGTIIFFIAFVQMMYYVSRLSLQKVQD